MAVIRNRYDFVYYFDCQDGNPNGDPDADNQPRIDPETSQGLVSDVCLKRRIRDYVYQSQQEEGEQKHGYDIFVLAGHTLESRQKLPYGEERLTLNAQTTAPKEKENNVALARTWMCNNFYDIRAFGAVMNTADFNCGQVRGPVQLTFARSVDPVLTTEHAIARQAVTRERDLKGSLGTFGRKHTIAYGLYRAYGFITPAFAEIGPDPLRSKGTGFTEEDLMLLWKALGGMFDLDRSAGRGLISPRKLVVFKHISRLGDAPAHTLFEMVMAFKKEGVIVPRQFADYDWLLPSASELPKGVEILLPWTE